MQNKGFTLIELMVAISIMAVLSTIGIASFVSYKKVQTLNTAAINLVTDLRAARARSVAVIKPTTCITSNYALLGYQLKLVNNGYQVDVRCNGFMQPGVTSVQFPSSLILVTTSTSAVTFLFQPLTGIAIIEDSLGNQKRNGTITICQASGCSDGQKIITVTGSGIITSN